MPFFFWLSGMLYSSDRYSSFNEYAKRKCRVLLKPLLLFMLLNFALTYLFRIEYYTIDKVLALYFPGAMWFIFVLLLTELAFYPIAKQGRTTTMISVITAFCVSALLNDHNVLVPMNVCSTTVALGFYGLGYLMKEFSLSFFSDSHRWTPATCVFGMCLPAIAIFVYHIGCDLSGNYLPHPEILYAAVAVAISLSLVRLSAYIPQGRLHGTLTFIGRNSITALCLHMFFINVSCTYIHVPSHLMYKVIECVFVIGMSILASYVVSRWGRWMIR